ncbi:hypothetical protein FQA39_LY06903 [Lamprigera yunnana]|nr:hypothetical protein FQA39_LY06903 [Lamprigera yunnana]
MTSSSCSTNKLAEEAQRKRWSQRRTILTPLKSNQMLEFPELTERDLKILFTGTYQLSQTMRSLVEIVDEEENINLQFEKEIPNIVQHVTAKVIEKYKKYFFCVAFEILKEGGPYFEVLKVNFGGVRVAQKV